MSIDDVVLRSTWNPAKEIHHEELGNTRHHLVRHYGSETRTCARP